jgi:hypothetical protein
MLNKNICINCINKLSPDFIWGKSDEVRWTDNEVVCPIIGSSYTDKLIRNDCHYKLEQLLKETTKNGKHY